MASQLACRLVELFIWYFHDNAVKVVKHVTPAPEGNHAEIIWEDESIHLFPHTTKAELGQSIIHELEHLVFQAGEEQHEQIEVLERLIWRGLSKRHRDAILQLAEE